MIPEWVLVPVQEAGRCLAGWAEVLTRGPWGHKRKTWRAQWLWETAGSPQGGGDAGSVVQGSVVGALHLPRPGAWTLGPGEGCAKPVKVSRQGE